jgi:Yip1 domain
MGRDRQPDGPRIVNGRKSQAIFADITSWTAGKKRGFCRLRRMRQRKSDTLLWRVLGPFPVLWGAGSRRKTALFSPKFGQPVPGEADLDVTPDPSPQPPSGLIERVKNILLTPKSEWIVIAGEPTSLGRLYGGYVAPMAGFAAVMSFMRMSVAGVGLPFGGGTIRLPIASGVMSAAVTFILGLLGLFLVGIVINVLAPIFSGVRDQRQALKAAAYALTPAWLGTALTFLPLGALLQFLAGIYGIYVLHLGLPVLMRAGQRNAVGYTATVVVCTLLIGILFGVIGAALGGGAHMSAGGGATVWTHATDVK